MTHTLTSTLTHRMSSRCKMRVERPILQEQVFSESSICPMPCIITHHWEMTPVFLKCSRRSFLVMIFRGRFVEISWYYRTHIGMLFHFQEGLSVKLFSPKGRFLWGKCRALYMLSTHGFEFVSIFWRKSFSLEIYSTQASFSQVTEFQFLSGLVS